MHLPVAITAREPAWRWATVIAGLLVVLACAWRAIYRFDNGDFKLHWEFGRRILAGESLYAGGHHATYPPFWAVAHSPFALVPMPVALPWSGQSLRPRYWSSAMGMRATFHFEMSAPPGRDQL